MNSFLFFAAIILAFVAVLALLYKKQSGKGEAFPYESCGVLFSPAERSFLGVLEQAIGPDFQLFGKIRLNDLICVRTGLPKASWQAAYNRIDRKHIDFVICRRDDFSVVAAIEFDDKSHARRDRVERDAFLDKAFAAAGIQLLRFPAQKGYVLEEVKGQLAAAVSPSQDFSTTPTMPSETPKIEGGTAERAVLEEASPSAQVEAPVPTCQKCGTEMVKRKASKGKYAGQWFWACASFPKCRNITPITG